jgi:hypothetical protein
MMGPRRVEQAALFYEFSLIFGTVPCGGPHGGKQSQQEACCNPCGRHGCV